MLVKVLLAKKKTCIIFHAKNEAKFLEILKELFNKIKLLGLKLKCIEINVFL